MLKAVDGPGNTLAGCRMRAQTLTVPLHWTVSHSTKLVIEVANGLRRMPRYRTRFRWTCVPLIPAPDAPVAPVATNLPCRPSRPERLSSTTDEAAVSSEMPFGPTVQRFVHCLDLGSLEMNQRHVTAPASFFWMIRVRGLWLNSAVPLDVPILTMLPSQRPSAHSPLFGRLLAP